MSLLTFCLNASDFQYVSRFYHKSFGCPMGSPVSVLVVNLVMEDIEDRILASSCFDVFCWKRYVDDTWVLLPKSSVTQFFEFINSVEPSLKFTIEHDSDDKCISFLDVSVIRNFDCTFSTNLYFKPTDTGRHLSFFSHQPLSQKRSVVLSLMNRVRTISSKHADCVA